MMLGNIVSATGSGLGCPDWPLCHGRFIPPLEPDVLIEYSHRLAAALTSILLVATVIVTFRARAGASGVRRLAVGAARSPRRPDRPRRHHGAAQAAEPDQHRPSGRRAA